MLQKLNFLMYVCFKPFINTRKAVEKILFKKGAKVYLEILMNIVGYGIGKHLT